VQRELVADRSSRSSVQTRPRVSQNERFAHAGRDEKSVGSRRTTVTDELLLDTIRLTDEQLLDIFDFLDRACDDLDALRHCGERIADIGVLCSIVLYSVNRRPKL
jgi:hypothetical protein